MLRRLALALAVVVIATEGTALADEAEDAYRDAVAAEQTLDFARALDGYRRALALRPSAPFALHAHIRRTELEAHSEGKFQPLARLESVRRDASKTSDPASLRSLWDDARAFPPGRVRAEAFLLVAEGFFRRLHDPTYAIPPAEALASDPVADRVMRSEATRILVDAYVAEGDETNARRAAIQHRDVAPELAARFVRVSRRRAVTLAATAVAVVVVAAGAFGALRVRARALRLALSPLSWLVAFVLGAGGAFFGRLYDESVSLRPFFLLAIGVLVVDRSVALLRAALANRSGSRSISLAAGVLGVLSAAVLALAGSDPAFLQGFGL